MEDRDDPVTARLSSTFGPGPSFVAILRGPEHRFEWVNPAYRQIVGDRDLIGLRARDALPDVRSAGLGEILDEVFATGEPFTAEELPLLLDRGDGSKERRVVSFVYQALRGEHGDITGVASHGVDVTAQVAGREALTASEAHFRSLIENSHDEISIFGPDGTIRYESPVAAALLGWEPEELVGRNCLELIHPDERDAVASALKAATDSAGIPHRAEHRLLHKDGSWRWFETVGHARMDAGGNTQLVINSRDVTERVSAEAELRRSAEHLRDVLDGLASFVGVLSPEGRIALVNRAALEITTATAEDVLGQPFADSPWWRSSPDRDLLLAALERGARGEASRFDATFSTGDREIVADFALTPLGGTDGQVTHLIPSAIDITDRVRATEALAEREERIRTLVELIPQLVWSTDPEGYHDYFNQRWYDYTGMPREGQQGWNWKEYLHPDDYDRAVAVWQHSLDTGEPYEIEYRIRRAADGAYRWFIGRAMPMYGPDGAIVQWFGTCTDAHDERMARESAQKNEQRFLAVTRAVNEVVWDWNIETGEHWWSGNCEEVLKVDPSGLPDGLEAWSQRIHPDDRDRVVASINALVESGEEMWSEEYRLSRGDGTIADIVDRGLVIRGPDGAPLQMIGSMLDVTERNRLESELRQSQKLEAVGKLAGGIAHDFNNIMAAITSYAEILLEDLPEQGSAHADVNEIRMAANRAAALTRQLLAFSRQQVLQPRQVNLNDVVTDLENMLRRLIGADIILRTRLADGLAEVHADPGQLEQVIVNLVVNARDAMPDGGELTIATGTVERSGDREGDARECVELKVRDTGVGMDADTLAHAFEPFFTTKEAGKGTGLGLSTVHGIVNQSGGVIEAESQPGRGTTLRILLPVSAQDDGPSVVGPGRRTPSEPAPATVLLVEDEPAVRSITRRALTRVGYEVVEAEDGVEALELLDRRDDAVDLVLTDLTMPRMGGIQLVEEIRRLGLEPAIVFMSGYAEEESIGKASMDVRGRFLAKPFTIDQLVSAVAAAQAANTVGGVEA